MSVILLIESGPLSEAEPVIPKVERLPPPATTTTTITVVDVPVQASDELSSNTLNLIIS